jgi:UDP-N-acetylmuramoyl-tripeptide--D-alanyl-D-alanine ligase
VTKQSPIQVALKLALDSLYEIKAPQKIAVLGNMNELGKYSETTHTEIGTYCDPKQLDLVVTIGPDANKYLAPAAEAKGCSVKIFENPYDAGTFLKPLIKKGAVILVKGSQNKVFAEETIKSLLANPADESKLVRQSQEWLNKKQKAFGK